ncbi:hypothetical protein ACFV9E_15505 [Streptomyces sp. NPDC059835]|uniref:hypothetical protein n=1 Tax=Streptomyces sp. NPDC059835 TaxID=3346967 RepID=UPI003669D3EE
MTASDAPDAADPRPAGRPRRRHRRTWIAVALLGTLLVLLPTAWQTWSLGAVRSEVLAGGGDGRPVSALEILGGDADITVTPRGDRQVGYRAEVAWSVGRPSVETSRLGDALRLTPHCPGADSWRVVAAGCSVKLAVTVPAGIPVKVTARSGRVSLTGLGGTVDAEVYSGRLEINGLRGALRARVDSGRLTAADLTSPQIDVRVGSGRAAVTAIAPPEQVVGKVGSGRLAVVVPVATTFRTTCEAGSGRCEVPDGLRDGTSPRTLDMEAGSGRAQALYGP